MTQSMRIKYTALWILAGMSLMTWNACYYDVEEELYPSTECDTEDVTYSGTVVPILQNNCYVCHGEDVNTAGITLEGYDNIIQYVNSGRLLGAIKHEPGYTPMPQGEAQLPDCTIAKIEQWVQEGAPDN